MKNKNDNNWNDEKIFSCLWYCVNNPGPFDYGPEEIKTGHDDHFMCREISKTRDEKFSCSREECPYLRDKIPHPYLQCFLEGRKRFFKKKADDTNRNDIRNKHFDEPFPRLRREKLHLKSFNIRLRTGVLKSQSEFELLNNKYFILPEYEFSEQRNDIYKVVIDEPLVLSVDRNGYGTKENSEGAGKALFDELKNLEDTENYINLIETVTKHMDSPKIIVRDGEISFFSLLWFLAKAHKSGNGDIDDWLEDKVKLSVGVKYDENSKKIIDDSNARISDVFKYLGLIDDDKNVTPRFTRMIFWVIFQRIVLGQTEKETTPFLPIKIFTGRPEKEYKLLKNLLLSTSTEGVKKLFEGNGEAEEKIKEVQDGINAVTAEEVYKKELWSKLSGALKNVNFIDFCKKFYEYLISQKWEPILEGGPQIINNFARVMDLKIETYLRRDRCTNENIIVITGPIFDGLPTLIGFATVVGNYPTSFDPRVFGIIGPIERIAVYLSEVAKPYIFKDFIQKTEEITRKDTARRMVRQLSHAIGTEVTALSAGTNNFFKDYDYYIKKIQGDAGTTFEILHDAYTKQNFDNIRDFLKKGGADEIPDCELQEINESEEILNFVEIFLNSKSLKINEFDEYYNRLKKLFKIEAIIEEVESLSKKIEQLRKKNRAFLRIEESEGQNLFFCEDGKFNLIETFFSALIKALSYFFLNTIQKDTDFRTEDSYIHAYREYWGENISAESFKKENELWTREKLYLKNEDYEKYFNEWYSKYKDLDTGTNILEFDFGGIDKNIRYNQETPDLIINMFFQELILNALKYSKKNEFNKVKITGIIKQSKKDLSIEHLKFINYMRADMGDNNKTEIGSMFPERVAKEVLQLTPTEGRKRFSVKIEDNKLFIFEGVKR